MRTMVDIDAVNDDMVADLVQSFLGICAVRHEQGGHGAGGRHPGLSRTSMATAL